MAPGPPAGMRNGHLAGARCSCDGVLVAVSAAQLNSRLATALPAARSRAVRPAAGITVAGLRCG